MTETITEGESHRVEVPVYDDGNLETITGAMLEVVAWNKLTGASGSGLYRYNGSSWVFLGLGAHNC